MKHIVHLITGLHRGGAETVLVTLCKELSQPPYSYQQTVIFFKDGPLRQEIASLGITVYHVSSVVKFWHIVRLVARLKPDSIHSSLWSANIIARIIGFFLRIPVYCALHTVSEHSGTLRNCIDRCIPVQPTGYIAVSEMVKKSYIRILPAQKITVITNGIPLIRNQKIPIQNNPTYTIGSVGRFVPVKNYHILLDAFALLHKEYIHTRLILVGHGPLEHALREQVARLHLQHVVTFIINKPAQEYYKHFDCFAQPSTYEGFSIALLEALQTRLPVIATGHAGKHTFLENKKHGLIIEPESVNTLYLALKFYMLNPTSAADYAQAGYEYVQTNHSPSGMAARYHHLFNKG